jgi:hypothetical protein
VIKPAHQCGFDYFEIGRDIKISRCEKIVMPDMEEFFVTFFPEDVPVSSVTVVGRTGYLID